MPISKKQLQRLIRLVSMLKENRYPNCSTFAAARRKADLDENLNVSCTPKTIFRDIQTLKNDFDAPIKFDKVRNGYYLAHHGWNFSCPQIYDDTEMLAAVIGARIAEHIFPDPMLEQIRNAVDYLLTYNNPEFLDKAQIDSLVITPSNRTKIDADVFMPLFYAWQNHQICLIEYLDSRENSSERKFEPHSLAFFDGIWYSKGFCYQRNEMRTLVLARIKSVTVIADTFAPDRKIIETVSEDDIFGADMINDAIIHCDAYLSKFIKTRPIHQTQVVKDLPNGECELYIARIPRYRLLTWIMHQCGRATLVAPGNLRGEILNFTEKLIKNHNS